MTTPKKAETSAASNIKQARTKPVYLVSGASGASGEHLVDTVLAQFPGYQVTVLKKTHIRRKNQIRDIITSAAKKGGTVVHTMVNDELRRYLITQGEKHQVVTIDLMGPLIDRLSDILGCSPKGAPGLYRKLHKEYFNRITAIEYTMAHDDGQRTRDLPSADIVLIGISRCGKTPLSMYLAVHGWKVANVPVVTEVPLPEDLFRVDRRRVIGLSIAYEQLLVHRKRRQKRMGVSRQWNYTEAAVVAEEMNTARKLFKKYGYRVIDVTDKPIESIAEEVIELLTVGPKKKSRRG